MSVEKFYPTFEPGQAQHEQKPYAQILNKPIQQCANLEALALWVYFQTMPENWVINPTQIMNHFNIGRDKTYSLLNFLIESNLLTRQRLTKEKGLYDRTIYIIRNGENFKNILLNKKQTDAQINPLPDLPEAAEPEAVNQDYTNKRDKTNKNKKHKENIFCANEFARDQSFDKFWFEYPRKKDKKKAHISWVKNKCDEHAEMIIADVRNRLLNDQQWQNDQFIPYPTTYLNNKRWEDDITLAKTVQKAKTGQQLALERCGPALRSLL